MALRAGWVPCVGIQPPKPSLQFIEEAATVTRECEGMLTGGKAQSSEAFSINDTAPKSKPAMKLVMNPKGVQDHTTVEQHYEQLMQESSTSSSGALPSHIGPSVHIPSSPEIAKDIINDMQSPTGKGAALFAKRKKRMDKFIVDETNVQRSSAYQQQGVVNSSFEQSFTNQVSSFSSSSTSSSGGGGLPQIAAPAPALTAPPGSKKRMQQERDMEQQKIMNEFLNKRESQFQMVKSPWEAALEGNAAAAFKQNTITSKMSSSSSFSSTSTIGVGGPATWLEGPKAVPVAAPLPKPTGGASLPKPPAPFARPAVNGPATLPDISTILTTSNPTKSFKAGGVTITPTLSPHLASKPVSVRSPRSSSVGHKPTEKRLSTIPKAAQYPFPSYLSLASKQGGCVRSSSTSSIPSLAASVSASNPVCDSDFDLKPGSPPIVVQPSHTEAHTNDLVENGESVVESHSSVQNNNYKDVKLRKVPTKDPSASASRPSSVHSASVKHGIDSPWEGGKACASFRPSNSSSPYDFSANASAEKEVLKLMSQNEKTSNSNRSFISLSSQDRNYFNSALTKPSTIASYPLNPTTASLTSTSSEKASKFKHDTSSSFQSIGKRFENKFALNDQSSSLNRSKSFSNYGMESPMNSHVDSPIKYAQVHKVATHPPVQNFASTYLVSPKVDKKVHSFNFDVGVKIHLDADDEDSNDEELDAYVAEIQRSITSSPIPLENISVEDLKPPEFFRSVSRNVNKETENSDQSFVDFGDGPFEEHSVVVASIFGKKSPIQQCTVSKPKVMNRDSLCPSGLTLKQQAVSNLEMLSTLSALSRASPDLRSSKSPEPASLPQETVQHNHQTIVTSSFEKSEVKLRSTSIRSFTSNSSEKVTAYSPTEKTKNEVKVDYDGSNATPASLLDESGETEKKFTHEDQRCDVESDSDAANGNDVLEQKGSKPSSSPSEKLDGDRMNTEFSPELVNAANHSPNDVEKQEIFEQDHKMTEGEETSSSVEDRQFDAEKAVRESSQNPTSLNPPISSSNHMDESMTCSASEEYNSSVADPKSVNSTSMSFLDDVVTKPVPKTQEPFSSTDDAISPHTEFNPETSDPVPISDGNADTAVTAKYPDSKGVTTAAAIASSTAVAFETTSASISDPHSVAFETTSASISDPHSVAELSAASPALPADSNAVNDYSDSAASVSAASNVDPVLPSSELAKPAESLSPVPPPSFTDAPGTGLVYSAEVKLEHPPKNSLFVQSAASPTPPAFKAAAPAPAVPTFIPAAATPVFVPGASSGTPAPPSGNQGVGFAQNVGVTNPNVGLGAANPALGAQFTPRATVGNVASPNFADKRKSANFNLAASGWGTYNEYYRPTSFASS